MLKRISLIAAAALLVCAAVDQPAHAQKRKKDQDKEKKEELSPWEVDTLIRPIPMNRVLFTDKVMKAQQKLDMRDGQADGVIRSGDENYTRIVTNALMKDISLLTTHIENMEIEHGEKIRFHRATESLLNRIIVKPWGGVPASYFKNSVSNLSGMIEAIVDGDIIDYVKKNDNEYTLENSDLLNDYPEARTAFFKSYGTRNPEKMIKKLEMIAKEPFADDIVAAVAKKSPGTILNYATSTNYMSSLMRRNPDKLVQTIVKIGDQSRSPVKALPFLEKIYSGKMSVSDVDKFIGDDVQYYKQLVQLKLDGSTMAAEKLDDEVSFRALKFVRVINELHEQPNAIRFKSIQVFNAPELYYMMIGGQDEIYTSSFTQGTFPLMMEKLKPETGNDLLTKVHKDHFRTFIRLSAGFNTLDQFLGTFTLDQKTALMKEFVSNLEAGNEDQLEDAVDVADAFGSIRDPELLDFLRNEVKSNYERVYKKKSRESMKGVVVYGLLSIIFNPDRNVQKDLPIPPATYVPYSSLVNDKNEVVIQTFFYGDDDGAMSYGSFKSNFPAGQWKATPNKYWVKYQSLNAKTPIVVYANLPLKEPEDEVAQAQLQKYLDENEIIPTMVIHRGHSYHLAGSLANLTPEVKIVMLGSCGGYHNLANVLDRSPDAHIISSKQTGAARVNEPIIKELLLHLQKAEDVDWVQCWTNLEHVFAKQGKMEQDLFNDYIPPHRNLGAIFIKAYRKMMEAEGS